MSTMIAVVAEPGGELVVDLLSGARPEIAEHLASYKVPRSVDFAAELARAGSGKLLKRRLRAPCWADRNARVG